MEAGNGESIKFWIDDWLHNTGPLVNISVMEVPLEAHSLKVSHYVTNDGDWDFSTFV